MPSIDCFACPCPCPCAAVPKVGHLSSGDTTYSPPELVEAVVKKGE